MGPNRVPKTPLKKPSSNTLVQIVATDVLFFLRQCWLMCR